MERRRCCAGAQAKTCAGHKQTPSTHLPDTNPVKDSGRVRCRHLCQACCPLKDRPTAIWNGAQIQHHACINQYDSLLGEVNGWKWIDYESYTLWLPESIWFDWPSCPGAEALLLWYSKVDFVLDYRLFNGPQAKDKTEPRLLLGVGSCSSRGPTGDETGHLTVPYHDKWSFCSRHNSLKIRWCHHSCRISIQERD